MSAQPILAAEGLRHEYGRRTVLEVDEVGVDSGGVLAILGRSGAGKSTLLRILALLERPDSGSVFVAGRAAVPSSRWARLRMATTLQSSVLWRGRVASNVGYGLKLRKVGRHERMARIEDALGLVGLTGFDSRHQFELSGGEAQRVALARALVTEPEVLLLDEPLAHIDEPLREAMAIDLRKFSLRTGCATVWVTHDRSEALAVSDQIAVIDDGRLLQHGPAGEVFSHPASEQVARLVGADNVLNGNVVTVSEGLASIEMKSSEVVAMTHLGPATEVLALIRPEDVSIWAQPPVEPSPRNRFEFRVIDLVFLGALAKVYLDGPFPLVAAITRPTVNDLALRPGSQVWAGFKATSVHVIRRS